MNHDKGTTVVAPQGAPCDDESIAVLGEHPELVPALWRRADPDTVAMVQGLVEHRRVVLNLESELGRALTASEAQRLAYNAGWRNRGGEA
jgi:hypothetical protein